VSACAFLFSIEDLEKGGAGIYSSPAFRALFRGILRHDEGGGARFRVLAGDLLFHDVAYSIQRVRFEAREARYSLHGLERTYGGDRKLLQTLIWDFCDSLEYGWYSLDQQRLPYHLGHDNLFAIAVSFIDRRLAAAIDADLTAADPYLGAFAVDAGNPIHQRVTVGTLPHSFDYIERSLVFDPSRSEDPFDPPPLTRHGDEWWVGLSFTAVRYRYDDEQLELANWPSAELSERGALSAAILARRAAPSHLQRLASELAALRIEPGMPTFDVHVGAMPRAADAVVEPRKLTHYVLNPEDERGGHKARLFKELLAIEASDWRYLAEQLKNGLADAPALTRVRSDPYGVHYHVIVPVVGRNGVVKPVLAAWEVRPAQPPRLVTAYVAQRGIDPDVLGVPSEPMVLPAHLTGDRRWEKLWSIADEAGATAATAEIPTPMYVVDGFSNEPHPRGEWIPEGTFGITEIVVPDARRGFARWLVNTARARTERGRGAVLVPRIEGMSLARARAYADAFCNVLSLNGIESSFREILD
jgi:hypothetical protein